MGRFSAVKTAMLRGYQTYLLYRCPLRPSYLVTCFLGAHWAIQKVFSRMEPPFCHSLAMSYITNQNGTYLLTANTA